MDNVRAVLLAGGRGTRMGRLAEGRLKPLVPFGGQCHLVDFSIANAHGSGLTEVLVASHHNESQLIRYLLNAWDRLPGFRIHFGPHDHVLRQGENSAFLDERFPERGTADALLNNAEHIFGGAYRDVLVLHADHVYRFDYREMLAQHRATGAALTMAYQEIERRYVPLFGMVKLDARGHVVEFVEKPERPTSNLVFAAFCLFRSEVLLEYLQALSGADWSHDISRDVIPLMLAKKEVIRGFRVDGYWEDIGTVARHHQAHLRLLGSRPTIRPHEMPLTLHPDVRRYHARFSAGVHDSLVATDLINRGQVERSVLYAGVQVGDGAQIRDSVLLPGCRVAAGVRVEDAIVLDGEVVTADRHGLGEMYR